MKSSKIAYQEEPGSRKIFDEMSGLLDMHGEELELGDDYEFIPQYETYQALADSGLLRIYTARNGSELVGYAVYYLTFDPHYKNLLLASQDALYLRPEERNGRAGITLVIFSEKMLKAVGAQAIQQHTRKQKDLTSLFTYLGYKPSDSIMTKRL